MDSGDFTLADLAKKIDDQARFTRSVSIICMLAIVGVIFFMLTEMFSIMPNIIMMRLMSEVGNLSTEYDRIQDKKRELKMKREADTIQPAPTDHDPSAAP
jgi:hypothetical protein